MEMYGVVVNNVYISNFQFCCSPSTYLQTSVTATRVWKHMFEGSFVFRKSNCDILLSHVHPSGEQTGWIACQITSFGGGGGGMGDVKSIC